jgi:hypothetical protein
VVKQYLKENEIAHVIRMIEEPETKVDALMLNIYNTPALVIDNLVLYESDLFSTGKLNEPALMEILRRHQLG